MNSATPAGAHDELWNLEGAAGMVAKERFPRGTPEAWALEMVCRRPADATEWRRSVVRGAQGAERALSALEFARHVVAKDAQSAIDAAVLAGRLQLLDPITERPTKETAGAFVLRSEVMALLDAVSKPRAPAAPRQRAATKPMHANISKEQQAGTQTATAARWGSHGEFKATAVTKVIEQHKSTPFKSRADAARWIEQNVPKVEGGTESFKFDTCDNWLKGSGWTAELSCDDWIALRPPSDGNAPS